MLNKIFNGFISYDNKTCMAVARENLSFNNFHFAKFVNFSRLSQYLFLTKDVLMGNGNCWHRNSELD